MTEKEKLTESLINLLNETYKYNNKANGYIDDETGNSIYIGHDYMTDQPDLIGKWITKDQDGNNKYFTWVADVDNIQDAPFKTFRDMKIRCSDITHNKAFTLPEIPDEVQQKFIEAINAYVEKINNKNNKRKKDKRDNAILLYPDYEYIDRMDPVDITNEKGILFGWFNDEEIDCYSTGYNTIKDLEKAIKSKQYMIEEFIDDEDWDELSGDECWEYVINTIEDSYVDNDSYWSMFLIDANNNYKILYCGSEEPVINADID